MAVNGNTITIKIGDVVVGSERGCTIDSAAEMLDVSTKSDDDAAFIAGKRTDTVTLSSFYIVSDTAQAALRTAYEAGSVVEVDWVEGGASLNQCDNALVSSISISAPDHGPAEAEVVLQCSGGWGTPD